MSRQRAPIARAVALVTLATCFAASTAAFNTTYRQQAEADARLSNGADVVITASSGTGFAPSTVRGLAHVRGVASVEPLRHRYAYIGNDLQDLYGVNATTVVATDASRTPGSPGAPPTRLFAKLARTRRRHPRSARRSSTTTSCAPAITSGCACSTAQHTPPRPCRSRTSASPRSSRLRPRTRTRSPMRATSRRRPEMRRGHAPDPDGGASPAAIGRLAREAGRPSGHRHDDRESRKDDRQQPHERRARGLTRVELGYALVLLAAATGLLLWLGLAERRRKYAIARALGARPRQLAAFVWAETGFVTIAGVPWARGAAWLTWMLVKLLTGVFDPPPTHARRCPGRTSRRPWPPSPSPQ